MLVYYSGIYEYIKFFGVIFGSNLRFYSKEVINYLLV